MKARYLYRLLCLLFTSLFVTCFLLSSTINAAAEVEITKVSALTGRSFFGDTIHGTGYLDNTPYTLTFNYFDSYTSPQCGINVDQNAIITSSSNLEQFDFLVYKAEISGSLPGLTRVVIPDDLYLRFGDYARGGIALSCPLSSVQSTPNSATLYPDNFYGEFYSPRADSRVTQDLANYYATMYFSPTSNLSLMFRPIFYEFSDGGILDSVQWYSLPVYKEGTSTTVLYLIILCPYIGSSMSGEPPAQTTTAVTTTDNSAGTTVVVDVDMTETNSLLGQIKQAILGIVDGIKGLFIPDPEYLEDFKEFFLGTDEEPGFLEDHLGGLYEAVELIDEFIESLLDITPHATFHVPAASIPLAGTNFQLGNWDLSVESEAIPQIAYDGLKWLIDFLATAAFLNMCKYKLEIFLNPDTEVVKEE